MSRNLPLTLLLSLSLLIFLAASPAHAEEDTAPADEAPPGEAEQNEEEDLELDEFEEEVLEDGTDSEAIYQDYQAEMMGEDPIEEADAWKAYLDTYHHSLFRLQIEDRIEALDEASFDEIVSEQERALGQSSEDGQPGDSQSHWTGEGQYEDRHHGAGASKSSVDAKSAEMDLREPVLLNMSANTRRKLDVGIVWGYQDYFNYELSFEWAFRRNFSAFGALRHTGKGIGTSIQAGAKYALIKDVRSGIVLSGAFSINLGYSAMDQTNFVVEPWLGFGWIASDLIQLQTSIAFDLRVDRLHTAVLWDLMLVITPTERIGIYIETRQKHSLFKPEGQPVRYLGFHQAGVGVKIRPNDLLEIGLGANIPYGWKHWKDYRYIGAHANLTFFFKNGPRF